MKQCSLKLAIISAFVFWIPYMVFLFAIPAIFIAFYHKEEHFLAAAYIGLFAMLPQLLFLLVIFVFYLKGVNLI